ncbi:MULTISPECIES: ABC transporter permease subunit [unclassified Paenibacillus]|uniref:ABC transporter permease n=1 Tax=unclassified Paenibacillus TaxID=185978 RepID=UPI0010434B5E|nr:MULTISPECIES: ABC transporter permease subunit [unclassified Paenibacillus]NIK68611.1 putative aldouronate transport system permease protein [Paenibacillus sp. BK720]TCM99102.1 putative aldouronate transport system permease protein [Paenibacillus sp. BK033]
MRNRTFIRNYHIMLMPGIALLLVFSVIPMFGIVIAFQDFQPTLGIFRSEWVGWENFEYMFALPDSRVVFVNTIIIASLKIVFGMAVPLTFALLLHEVINVKFKRIVQTIVYLPHFMSWVILSGIMINLLSLDGVVNQVVHVFGGEPIMFLQSNSWFRVVLVASDVWKEFGFNTIIYVAALTSINTNLYEAAAIDGAGRFQRLLYITIPSLLPTVILLATLSLGNVLNAGFEQILNLYNPIVYQTGDIIDTYVYRAGLQEIQYGLATAVGLLKSLVSFLLIAVSYMLAARFANYRIF